MLTKEQFKDKEDGAIIKFVRMKDKSWRFMEMDIIHFQQHTDMLQDDETADDVIAAGALCKYSDKEYWLTQDQSYGLRKSLNQEALFDLRAHLGMGMLVKTTLTTKRLL